MNDLLKMLAACGLTACLVGGCGGGDAGGDAPDHNGADHAHTDADHDDHDHAEGDHDGHDHGHDHDHEEVSLGTTKIGDVDAECWQAHGDLEPGKEMALVVKLPDSQNGAIKLRAWIGTEDRLSSMVGLADYAPSHDDYDVHVMAPDPLPEGAKWWIEIEYPDGRTKLGSIDAL
ncbi:MAG: hypothetical protein Tsb0013_04870 [Phycisphaerales bacterium]